MKQLKTCMILTLAFIVFGTCTAGADENVITLKIAHFLPSSSNIHKFILVPWCDKISKESGGKLKCQIYPSMQLGGSPAQLFDQVRDGVADIGWTVPTYQSGRFTKIEVFELPFMVTNSAKSSQALWEYIQKNALDEFKGTRLLANNLYDGSQFHFGNKSVKTLEDIKGLKMRTGSRIGARMLAALGAVPVQMPMPAVSEAISKNVVDGAVLPWEATSAFKIQEICKTHTETSPTQGGAVNGVFAFVMNPAKYNSLPPKLKEIIDHNSGVELSKSFGEKFRSFTAPARKIAVDRHSTINVLTDAEYKRWVKATELVEDGWIKEVNKKGGNGRALLENAKTLIKKYESLPY